MDVIIDQMALKRNIEAGNKMSNALDELGYTKLTYDWRVYSDPAKSPITRVIPDSEHEKAERGEHLMGKPVYAQASGATAKFYDIQPGDGTRYDFAVVDLEDNLAAQAIVRGVPKHAMVAMLSPQGGAYAFQKGVEPDPGYVRSKLGCDRYTSEIVSAMLPGLTTFAEAGEVCLLAVDWIAERNKEHTRLAEVED